MRTLDHKSISLTIHNESIGCKVTKVPVHIYSWRRKGGGGVQNKNLPWRKYRHFLELHIIHNYTRNGKN